MPPVPHCPVARVPPVEPMRAELRADPSEESTGGGSRPGREWAEGRGARSKKLRWSLALSVACAAVALGWLEYRAFTAQVANYMCAYGVFYRAEKGRDASGSYPKEMVEADVYGNAINYQTNGHDVLVVSYGADGVPDRAAYTPDAIAVMARRSACWDRNRDTVLLNGHIIQGCAK